MLCEKVVFGVKNISQIMADNNTSVLFVQEIFLYYVFVQLNKGKRKIATILLNELVSLLCIKSSAIPWEFRVFSTKI